MAKTKLKDKFLAAPHNSAFDALSFLMKEKETILGTSIIDPENLLELVELSDLFFDLDPDRIFAAIETKNDQELAMAFIGVMESGRRLMAFDGIATWHKAMTVEAFRKPCQDVYEALAAFIDTRLTMGKTVAVSVREPELALDDNTDLDAYVKDRLLSVEESFLTEPGYILSPDDAAGENSFYLSMLRSDVVEMVQMCGLLVVYAMEPDDQNVLHAEYLAFVNDTKKVRLMEKLPIKKGNPIGCYIPEGTDLPVFAVHDES